MRETGAEMREQRYIVRCYGGPLAGQLRAVIGSTFDAVRPPEDGWCAIGDGGEIVRMDYEVDRYEVRCYGQGREFPFGRRRHCAAVLCGYDMTSSEQREIHRELECQPWELFAAEILKDFDQWFAWQWYGLTGEITWKADRVDRFERRRT